MERLAFIDDAIKKLEFFLYSMEYIQSKFQDKILEIIELNIL